MRNKKFVFVVLLTTIVSLYGCGAIGKKSITATVMKVTDTSVAVRTFEDVDDFEGDEWIQFETANLEEMDVCKGDLIKVYYSQVTREPNEVFIDATSWKMVKSTDDEFMAAKPVIYLYPEKETAVEVKLTLDGHLTCTYPTYENGWSVTASPDGTIWDENGQVYNYLYWEGTSSTEYDFSKGFCVAGKDTAAFLENALAQLGLSRKEANEFIVYWLPLMQENPYNVIAFQTEAYTNSAKLDINPAPDTLIRVFMAWESANDYVELEPQELSSPERLGFTVVEWGGTEVIR